jgi:hypothetical protein
MAEQSKSTSKEGAERSADKKAIAKGIALRAADQAKHMVAKRIGKPGTDIDKLAKSLRLTGQQLEGNVTVPYVDKLAGRLEQLSGFLDELDTEEMVASVERFARAKPLLFFSGAVGAGIVAARFIKSSAEAADTSQRTRARSTTTTSASRARGRSSPTS